MKTPGLFDLTGRVAVVTGGNGGIGRGIALGLALAGAAVAVLGRNDEKNQCVLSELKSIGVPSIAVKVDLTDRAALEPALSKVVTELGGIDILVNNAGNVSLSGGVLNEKPEDWDNVIETQLNAVFLLSKLAAPFMISRKGGKIINIGSMYSFFGSALIPSYSAAKGAIIQLTKSMAIRGIYLTPPTPRCSVWGHERGFPANIAGVGTAFQQRGGVRRIPRNAALAERMVLSTVRGS